MDDILKLRELMGSGYGIELIKEDREGNCIISLIFSGSGTPIEGQHYYFVTRNEAVIRKAHEIFGK